MLQNNKTKDKSGLLVPKPRTVRATLNVVEVLWQKSWSNASVTHRLSTNP